jgi:pyruvate dehydrogenase E2 component (dihydrolipoamide acetyltransferase)/2-oxoisovalerate dehydrogenase E2 component (dihydrolipoyl transacylase)
MEFRLPELGEGVYEAELVSWLVKPGDAVKRGQNLVEVLTDKATMEVPSPFAGTITELLAEPGQRIKVGDVVLAYTAGASEPSETKTRATAKAQSAPAERVPAARQTARPATPAATAPAPAATPRAAGAATGNGPSGPVKAAPSVRYMARKLGVDLANVRGTGPQGRILIEDLTSILADRDVGKRPAPPEKRPDYGKPGTRLKLQGVRRKIAERMVHSKHTIPHYTYVDECDATDLVRLRENLRDAAQLSGVKITYLAFFVKAVVAALKQVPIVNASLDDEAGEIVLHDRYHVGIAVATPAGLIVPVVHDADRKDLMQVAREIERLSGEARAGKIRLEDLRGGTYTITSIGNIGGLFSAPVINHPEVAILGVGKITKRPVFDAAGNIRPADIVYLSFGFDHRVVDGAVGAAFGNTVIHQLQHPAALLLSEQAGK